MTKWLTTLLVMGATLLCPAANDEMWVYFGTYTARNSQGIYLSKLDLKTGQLSEPRLAAAAKQPSFLAIHPNGEFLYAVNELMSFGGEPTGAVSSFRMDRKTGALQFLNQQPSGGGAPCHLVVDKAGRNVLVANYAGGSVSVLPLADGSLKLPRVRPHSGTSVNKGRQEAAHAHAIHVDAANKFAVSPDLGADKIFIYKYWPRRGLLEPHTQAFVASDPGAGPRHFAFHPKGKLAFANNELLSTVTSYTYDGQKGKLEPIHSVSTLPGRSDGNTTAEIQVHPNGKFVYCSNRGHDSIAVFSVSDDGKLNRLENISTGGKIPRNFGIDPSGKYLLAANQESDTVVVFSIHPKTGRLTPTGQQISVPMPVCVKFVRVD